MDCHNNGPRIELLHIPQQGSHVELLPGEDEHREDKSSVPFPRIRGFLRQFRLGSLTIAFGWCFNWRSNTEYRKVAMYHSQSIAATHVLFHLIPLGGAITLFMLQWTSYLASFTEDDSTMLQFVAKLHELFLQASIIEIIFCFIRPQVIDGFVPLGLLSGIVQATQLAYIWSLDYMSIFRSRAFRGWRRLFFATVIPALILLTSLVGPSSAILMIPRSGSARSRKAVTKYARKLTEAMYPAVVGELDGFKIDVTSLNMTVGRPLDKWGDIEFPTSSIMYQSYLSQDSRTADGDLIYDRVIRMSSLEFTEDDFQDSILARDEHAFGMQVNITLPTWFSALSFSAITNDTFIEGLTFLDNGTASVQMAFPVVVTQCCLVTLLPEPGAKVRFIPEGATYPRRMRTLSNYPTLESLADVASNSIERFGDLDLYAPVWGITAQPELTSLFGVFISRPVHQTGNTSRSLSWLLESGSQRHSDDTLHVTTCTLSAFWEFGEVQFQQSSMDAVVKTLSYPKTRSRKAIPITLNTTGIDAIQNAHFHSQLSEPFMYLTDAHLRLGPQSRLAYTLGTTFASGLSRIPFVERVYIDTLESSANRSEWELKQFENGEMAWYPPPGIDPANTTAFTFTLTDYGYGYGTRSISVYLAMTAISTYCIIAFIYVIYTIVAGSSSNAWNSGIELVTLALQSKKPDHLGHTSVGIDSIKTFGESVGIRVNADDELELVFEHDRDFEKRGLRKIERNKEY